MTILTRYDQIDKQHWAEFVRNHPQGNVFQTPEIVDCYLHIKGHTPIVIVAMDGHAIVGILVACILAESGLKEKLTARSIIQGGPLAKDDNAEIIDALLHAYKQEVKGRAIYTQIRNHSEQLYHNDIYQKYGFSFVDHLNFLITLDNEEAMWDRIGKGRIKQIKKAQKNNLQVDVYTEPTEELIREGYEVIKSVYKRAGLPLTSIDEILAVNKHKLLVLFAVRNQDGRMLGCRMGIAYRDCLYGWYAGSYQEYYSLYPNDMLIWETLLWGCKQGYKIFDYGGAGEPNKPYGVRGFKQQMGGKLTNYGRYELIHKPIIYYMAVCVLFLYHKLKRK